MNTRVSRRGFGLAVAMMMALPGVAAAQDDPIVLKYSNAAVPEDWHVKAMDVFAERLEELVPGRFELEIYPSGSLFKQGSELAAMQRGNLEMAHYNAQDISLISQDLSIFTTPYLLRDPEHMLKVMDGEIGEWVFDKVMEEANIKLLSTMLLGTRQVGLRFEKDVNVPADLNGVKMRMPNTPEWLFMGEALGASAMPMAFGELYLALKQGTVDAQDAQPSTVRSAKLNEVLKQVVLTGHLVQPLILAMDGDVFNGLTEEEQAAVLDAARLAADYNNENRVIDEEASLEALREQGIKVTTPDVEAFREHALNIYLESKYAETWPEGMYQQIVDIQ
ncbi:MAG: DctP family TRAP transporter solute-binding subunit [Pseudomonadota bacterium]|nr:DctP family TRAP transporter solute-binding subunit [Pseudomonadota bacterium]